MLTAKAKAYGKTKSSRQKQKAHGKSKKLTAKPKSSRQKKKAHGKSKKLTAKAKAHGKTKKLTAKEKSSRQKQKAHGKSKKLTAKEKSSLQKQKAHGKSKNSRQNQKAHGKTKLKPEKGVIFQPRSQGRTLGTRLVIFVGPGALTVHAKAVGVKSNMAASSSLSSQMFCSNCGAEAVPTATFVPDVVKVTELKLTNKL